MKDNNLFKNITFNVISQMFSVIVPFLTAPYVARVFSPRLIGEYSFALANVSYFVLLESLGFGLYGQIKIATVRDDERERSLVFFEIILLKIFLMAIATVVYLAVLTTYTNSTQRVLGYIMLINIVSNGIDTTWFLNGMENFKTTAVRNVVVRIVNIISVFGLIKNNNDFFLYAFIMQIATLVGFFAMLPVAKSYIKWPGIQNIHMLRHVKPAWIYFVPGLVTTIFTSSDKTMLGIFSNNNEVGYYEQAHKIVQICMNAISAIGNTILPRVAYLHKNDEANEKANDLFYLSFGIVAMISMPMSLGIMGVADNFIPLFFGPGYEKSIILLIVLSMYVLLMSWSNLVGQQCLIARGKQGLYNIAVVSSAVVNLVFNYLLIRCISSMGAAIATVVSSCFSMLIMMYMSRFSLDLKRMGSTIWNYVLASGVMFCALKIISFFLNKDILGLIIQISTSAILYFSTLLLLKDKYLYSMIKR